MAIDYKSLPVYAQKQKILDCLEKNQVVIVESPTGSGKTTQIPVILYEAGYATGGMIGVTQPRRIAALSVSEFISKQLGTTYPGLVGYKMRFEDFTNQDTRIKIMTDGILLQEMKLDPWLSKYSVLMIDEAHERSLNIDFVLGLVKRVLKERSDFRVIVSSATMNTKVFSEYFDNAPIVSIDTVTFPVALVYDPVPGGSTTTTDSGCDQILTKIYGEFCSLRGEMKEFKKRTLERLEEVEGNFKQSSVERAARLCRTVSLITGLISIISASYTVLSKFIEKGAIA